MKYFSFRLFSVCLLFVFFHIQFAYGASQPSGETPASLACIYGLTPYVPGCPINGTSIVPATGSGAIVVIDGQDDPNAYAELTQFSSNFPGLNVLQPCNTFNTNQPCFQQYYATGNPTSPCVVANNNASTYTIKPAQDIEPELDIEWAHAMAPYASIYMVESQGWLQNPDDLSNPNITGLINGLQCATNLLQTYNGSRGIISYSNSNEEWAGETALDSYFQTPGIIYIASSGDYSAPARYPASSPYVIGAGGTSIQRDSSGNYIDQVGWQNSGSSDGKTGGTGGPSVYESRPSYQNNVQRVVGTHRGTPDISFAAEGIDVFCCQLSTNNKCCGVTGKPNCEPMSQCSNSSGFGSWTKTGGTSLASPALAGIINSAHSGATTTTQELSNIYNGAIKNYHTYWTDILSGNNGFPALPGYDFVTGLGVPRGYGGK